MDNPLEEDTYMRTVRVRVFVSVALDGSWETYGKSGMSAEGAMLMTHHHQDDAGYWIEADLPLPNQSPEIVATVTRAE